MIFPFALACATISFRESGVAPRNGRLLGVWARGESQTHSLAISGNHFPGQPSCFQNLEWPYLAIVVGVAPRHPGWYN